MNQKRTLLSLLRLRRDVRYRAGLLQAAAIFGVITQQEWQLLTNQIKKTEPTLPGN